MKRMFKTLFKSVREYKRESLLAPLFILGEVVLEVIIPYLMAQLLDKGIYAGQMNMIYKIGLWLVLCAIASLACGVFAAIFASRASAGFGKNLRKDLYYKVQDYSFSNIDKFSTSSIVTRLTTDVSNIQMAYQMLIRGAIRSPLMLVFSLIMAMRINIKLSLVFLLMVPLIGFSIIFIGRKAHPIFEKVFNNYDELNNVVEENVSGIRVVKSYVLEDAENEKFKKKSQEIFEGFSKAEKLMALNSPIMQFAMYCTTILICWFGARIIVTSNMSALTTGQLSSLITYSIQILMSLMMLSMMLVLSTLALSAAERIFKILDENPDITNPENPVMDVKDGSIKFDNVSFSYINSKDKEVLKNINLDIKSGETIGIIGGTGDGKSSLVNLIPRLYDVTEGTLLVGGVNVKDYDLKTLRDKVSCVLQKNVLFSGTIKDNLRWGNKDATDDEMINACKLAQADGFIQDFPDKYDTFIEQGGTNVSGGQKQRLCIARALLKDPKILILDDSTSAVDTKTDSAIRKAFREEIPNVTKIIIAQRIASVEDADKIIVLNNGKIDGIGTHDELLKCNEIYKEVYESQTEGGED